MGGIGRRKRRARSRRRGEAGRGEEAGGGERGREGREGRGGRKRRRKALTMICPHLDKKINKQRVSIQLGIWVESSQLLF